MIYKTRNNLVAETTVKGRLRDTEALRKEKQFKKRKILYLAKFCKGVQIQCWLADEKIQQVFKVKTHRVTRLQLVVHGGKSV